jgi:hypothetical protein
MDLWKIPLLIGMISMNIIQTAGFCDSSMNYGGCTCYMDGVDIFLTCTTSPIRLNGLLEDEAAFTTSIGVVGEELPDLLTYDISKWSKLIEIYDNNRRFKCAVGMCVLSDHTFPTKLPPTQQLDLIKTTPSQSNGASDSVNMSITTLTSTNNGPMSNPPPPKDYTTMVSPPLVLTTTNPHPSWNATRIPLVLTTTTNPHPSWNGTRIHPSMVSIKIKRSTLRSLPPLSTQTRPRTSTNRPNMFTTNNKTINITASRDTFNDKNPNNVTPTQTTLLTDGFNESTPTKTHQSYSLKPSSVGAKSTITYKTAFFFMLIVVICLIFSNIILFRIFLKKRHHYSFPQESIELNDFI